MHYCCFSLVENVHAKGLGEASLSPPPALEPGVRKDVQEEPGKRPPCARFWLCEPREKSTGGYREVRNHSWQHILPGSPTLFISIIKSANIYHLSKICSNNKHSYRAYYGQWWDINLYPWKQGRKAKAIVPYRGVKLAVDEAKAFSSLMTTNGKLHWFFCLFVCSFLLLFVCF